MRSQFSGSKLSKFEILFRVPLFLTKMQSFTEKRKKKNCPGQVSALISSSILDQGSCLSNNMDLLSLDASRSLIETFYSPSPPVFN